MPQVVIRHCPTQPYWIAGEIIRGITPELREMIATALSCDEPDGALTAADISIVWEEHASSELTHDLQIQIMANDYPSRRANLDDRCAQIEAGYVAALKDLRQQKPGLHQEHGLAFGQGRYYVWPCLVQASFREGQL